MPYIISTMTNSVAYQDYKFAGDVNSKQGLVPSVRKRVVVQGGAGIPSMRSGFGDMAATGDGLPIWTSEGMVTPVSDENLAFLENHPVFQKHLSRGKVKVVKSDVRGNHAAVKKEVSTMLKRDQFTPLDAATVKSRVNSKVQVKTLEQETEFRL